MMMTPLMTQLIQHLNRLILTQTEICTEMEIYPPLKMYLMMTLALILLEKEMFLYFEPGILAKTVELIVVQLIVVQQVAD